MSKKNDKGSNSAPNDELEPIQVNKWDGTAIKNALDDAVKETLLHKLPTTEDHSLMDGRLWICFVAVAVAGGALAYDFLNPFPASRPVLVGCVATYFFLMAVLTLYTTYKEKGIFVVALQKDPAGLDPPCIWEASSNMKKFDDIYDLALSYTDGKTKKSREATFSKSCAEFFDENGTLYMDLVETAVMKLHRSLIQEKKDN